MKFLTRSVALGAVVALTASPAFGLGVPEGTPTAESNPGTAFVPEGTPTAESNPGTQHQPSGTPTGESNPGTAHRLAAPGRYCKDASKQRVEGEKGTAFSVCVKAQARLRSGQTSSPREACKDASKQRAEGAKGTAFSACVKAGAKLLKDMKAQNQA